MLEQLRGARDRYGLAGLFPLAVRRLRAVVVRRLPGRRAAMRRELEFDERYHLETLRPIELGQLEIDSANKRFGVRYEATPVAAFAEMLGRLGVHPARFTFVDLGCGKGRTLVLAAAHGFGRVVGVEFAPLLCEIARENVERYRRETRIEAPISIECADAAAFALPPGDLVVYLYNPFSEQIMSRVAARISDSLAAPGRDLFVVYYNPRWRRIFDREARLTVHASSVWSPESWVIYRSVAGRRREDP
jgi:SAM-dependent methyltransferase